MSPAQARERKLVFWRALPFRQFGSCCSCRARRDSDDRPLEVRGAQRRRLRCLRCFLALPLSRMPSVAAS